MKRSIFFLTMLLMVQIAFCQTPDYLCFTAVNGPATIGLTTIGNPPSVFLEYSTNGTSWSSYTINQTISLSSGGKVYFRATSTNAGMSSTLFQSNTFVMTGQVAASGDVTSLVDKTMSTRSVSAFAYHWLFYNCTSLISAPKLPATTLNSYCYCRMFEGCTNLISAPDTLPAMTLANNCYDCMFQGCTNMKTTPELPATTLASYCYNSMFEDCSSLTKVPDLPATTLVDGCYTDMFMGCSNIKLNLTGPGKIWKIPAAAASSAASASGWGANMFNSTGGTLRGQPVPGQDYYYEPEYATITTNQIGSGTIRGGGRYEIGDTVTLTAQAALGYYFAGWSNASEDSTITFIVTQDTVFVANFIEYNYILTVKTNFPQAGIITGGGYYMAYDTATLSVTELPGHHFRCWSNGNTNSTMSIVLTSDTTITAIFDRDPTLLTVMVNDLTKGSVSVSGSYEYYGDTAILTAVAKDSFRFQHWGNGDTASTIKVVLTSDTTIEAYFGHSYCLLSTSVNDTVRGTVTGAGKYDFGDKVQVVAHASGHYHFSHWSDGSTDSVYSFTINGDVSLTAYFYPDEYIVTVLANDSAFGTVSGSGTYKYLDMAELTAIPNDGCKLSYWSNGYLTSTFNIEVVCDTVLTAYFTRDNVPVESVNDIEYAVSSEANQIVVCGASNIFICDANGKIIYNGKCKSDTERFYIHSSGIYFVKVDNKKNFKVVVK